MADSFYFQINFSALVLTWFLTSATAWDLMCNKESIQLCYSTFEKTPILHQTIPYVRDTYLPKFCKSFDSFSECYSHIPPKCLNDLPLLMAAQLEGVHASYGFLCRNGAEDYKKSKYCFLDSGLQSQSDVCKTALEKQLKESNGTNYADTVKKRCRAGIIYIGCIDNYVSSWCEEDRTALNWIHTFNTESLKALFTVYRCAGFNFETTTKSSGENMSIIVGVLVGLLAVVVVLIIIIFLCFFFKNKYHRKFCSRCVCFNWILDRFINKPPPYNPSIVNSLPAFHTNMPSSSEISLGIEEVTEKQTNHIYVDETSRDNSFSSSQLPYKSSTQSFFLNKSPSSSQNIPERDSNISSKSIFMVTSPDNIYSCGSNSSTYYDTVNSQSLTSINDLTEQDYY